MKIKKFEDKYLNDVSNLWSNSFNENFLSILGKKIITSYLSEFLKIKYNKGFILKKNNQIIAFVLYGDESKIINKILIKNSIYIVLKLLKFLLLIDIKNILLFINIAFFNLILKLNPPSLNALKELLIVVVDKKYHGKGYGQKLIKNSIKDKYFDKKTFIFVKTLSYTKQNIKFYKKLDFKYVTKVFYRVFLKLKIE